MKQKHTKPDIAEKRLLELDDVFADVINFVLNDGKPVVQPEELISRPSSSKYRTEEGDIHENLRDVCKEWKKGDVRLCILGLENQSYICRTMPVRVLGYDYAAYCEEIKEHKEKNKTDNVQINIGEELLSSQRLKPVITIVLYFGMEDLDGPLSLYDMLDIPEEYKRFVPDYPINLVRVAFLEPEEIKLFKSDFKLLADITRCNRLHINADLRYNKDEIRHAEELYEALKALVNKGIFKSVDDWLTASYIGGANMTTYSIFEAEHDKGVEEGKAIGKVIGKAEGRAIGRAIGRAEGRNTGKAETLLSLVQQGIITKEIAIAHFGGTFADIEAAANK